VNYRTSLPAILLLSFSCNTLAQSCDINVTPMAFGSLDGFPATVVDSAGSVNINCDPQVSYLIRMDAGRNSNGGFTVRKMILLGGSETMEYNLYRDSSRTMIWGDGTGGSSIVTGMGAGVTQDVPVYGRIHAGQNLMAGKYTDSITVTVEW